MFKWCRSLVYVWAAVCLGVSGCSLNFLETDGENVDLHNETALVLEIEFESGLFTRTVPPGELAQVPVLNEGCSTTAIVVRSNGNDYASLSDERLCEDGTYVVIRGEGDMSIVDNR